MLKSVWKLKQNMAKSHKTCMEQAEIIDTFGTYQHLLVAVDKFTKWIEAVPITSSTALMAVNFIKSIIFRFCVPHNIITDNGTNFTAAEFQNFYQELGIKINYASFAHPQSND